MKIQLLAAFALSGLLGLFAQAGSPPSFPAKSLSKQAVLCPDDLPKQASLLIIGFTMDSRSQTERWSREARALSEHLRLTIYDVAVIEDAPRLVRGFIFRSMRKNTPKDLHDTVLVVSEPSDSLKAFVDFDDSDKAFILLLDQNHAVTWSSSGECTPEKLAILKDTCSRANGASIPSE